jgi:hypothetical protein
VALIAEMSLKILLQSFQIRLLFNLDHQYAIIKTFESTMLLKYLYCRLRINCDPSLHPFDKFFAGEFSLYDEVDGTLLGFPSNDSRPNQHGHYGVVHGGATEPYFSSYQFGASSRSIRFSDSIRRYFHTKEPSISSGMSIFAKKNFEKP